jgi:hypothetical protein
LPRSIYGKLVAHNWLMANWGVFCLLWVSRYIRTTNCNIGIFYLMDFLGICVSNGKKFTMLEQK